MSGIPSADEILQAGRVISPPWYRFFTRILRSLTVMETGSEYTVSTVPDAAWNGPRVIFVSDEAGGATIAFTDGTSWRRVSDRAVIS